LRCFGKLLKKSEEQFEGSMEGNIEEQTWKIEKGGHALV